MTSYEKIKRCYNFENTFPLKNECCLSGSPGRPMHAKKHFHIIFALLLLSYFVR
jgi:hypothetical protein